VSSAADRAHAGRVLLILWICYAVNFIDRNILSVLLQPIKEDLQVSDTAMGVLTGFAFAVFYTFAGIPIARIADRGSRRALMAAGVAFWSLMTAASGLARSYAELAIARVLVGVGEASATPAAHSLISDYFPPERRTRALAIYNTGSLAGVLFGLLLGGWLAESVGWRTAFAVVGLPGLLVAVLVRLGIPEPVRGGSEGLRDAGLPPSLRETLAWLGALPTFRHIALAAALYSVTSYAVMTWAPTFMRRVHGLSYAEVGLQIGLVIGVAGAIGMYAGGIACDRLALRDRRWLVWLPACTSLLLAPFYALFALAGDPTVAILAFVPVNLVMTIYAAPTYTLTQGLASLRMRAMASAIVLFVLNLIGLGVGPTLVGVLNDWLEPSHGAGAIRVSLLVMLIASLWASVHSVLAARTLEADLARTAGRDQRHDGA
jgi:predicted MFS family arabinose efflux permease